MKFVAIALLVAAAVVAQQPQFRAIDARDLPEPVHYRDMPIPVAQARASEPFVVRRCDSGLWAHVYNPKRLLIVQWCIAVTGTIRSRRAEPDGDDHIRLELDPKFRGLLNAENKAHQRDCLVLEPVCEHAVTQEDAKAACRGYDPGPEVRDGTGARWPRAGTRVRVTGAYVLDTERPGHSWMEIHPVSSIEVIP